MTDSAAPKPDPNDRERSPSEPHLHQDISEADLWDLDEAEPLEDPVDPVPDMPEAPPEIKATAADWDPQEDEDVEETAELAGVEEPEAVTKLVPRSGRRAASSQRNAEMEDPFSDLEEDEEPAADVPSFESTAHDLFSGDEEPEELPVTLAPQPQPEETVPEPTAAEEEPAAKTPEAGAPQPQRIPFHAGEKAALGIFALLLLLGVVWVFRTLSEEIPTTSTGATEIDYPVTGNHARIAETDTYWRRPITTGENRDRFRQGARLLPVAQISLDPEAAGSGALRVFFRNDRGEIVGDPATIAFSGGRFNATGTPQVEVTGTDGFHEDGMHAAYLAGQSEPWTLDIQEAAAPDAPAAEFSPLLQTPLSPERR